MKDIPEYEKDLASIRSMMERSVKFISLSGLSGVLAGLYALAGAAMAYGLLYYPGIPSGIPVYQFADEKVVMNLVLIAVSVLFLSLSTGFFLSQRKAKKLGVTIWNPASRQLMLDLLTSLVTGGIFILILLSKGFYIMIAPACLLFYGLALVQASRNTFSEILYLGFTEILLGLLCAAFPGNSLVFWGLGFGVMHVMYGAIMYFRHER